MENRLVFVRSQGFNGGVGQGGYKGVVEESLVVMEQFYVLIVVVVTRNYTGDKTAKKNVRTNDAGITWNLNEFCGFYQCQFPGFNTA